MLLFLHTEITKAVKRVRLFYKSIPRLLLIYRQLKQGISKYGIYLNVISYTENIINKYNIGI